LYYRQIDREQTQGLIRIQAVRIEKMRQVIIETEMQGTNTRIHKDADSQNREKL
jgi:hypothetical protein